MQPIKLTAALACLCLYLLACNKHDSVTQTSESISTTLQNWLHENGGIYKNGTLKFKTSDGAEKTIGLNWSKLNSYQYHDTLYYSIPFESWTSPNHFNLVVRKRGTGFEGAINVTDTSAIAINGSDTLKGTIERYTSLNGTPLNGWYTGVRGQPQPIYFTADITSHKNAVVICQYYSYTTYTIGCYGGLDGGTVCVYSPQYYAVTLCSTPMGRDPGDAGADGGNYPPDGPGIGFNGTLLVNNNDILDNLESPCYSTALSNLKQVGLCNVISDILIGTFGSSDKININFTQSNSTVISFSTAAQTTGQRTPSGLIQIQVTLNDNVLKHASQEYVAETMFHEILHGYMDTENLLGTPSAQRPTMSEAVQHISMAQTFVNGERAALQEIFGGLSDRDANAVILGGLISLNTNPNFDFSGLLNTYALTMQDVQNISSAYLAGSTGTKCVN